MSIREIKTQNHEEWVQLRKKSIGGSDAGAIAGYNPYMAAHSLWAEKSGPASSIGWIRIPPVCCWWPKMILLTFLLQRN